MLLTRHIAQSIGSYVSREEEEIKSKQVLDERKKCFRNFRVAVLNNDQLM